MLPPRQVCISLLLYITTCRFYIWSPAARASASGAHMIVLPEVCATLHSVFHLFQMIYCDFSGILLVVDVHPRRSSVARGALRSCSQLFACLPCTRPDLQSSCRFRWCRCIHSTGQSGLPRRRPTHVHRCKHRVLQLLVDQHFSLRQFFLRTVQHRCGLFSQCFYCRNVVNPFPKPSQRYVTIDTMPQLPQNSCLRRSPSLRRPALPRRVMVRSIRCASKSAHTCHALLHAIQGRKFGLLVCFDVEFLEPATQLLHEQACAHNQFLNRFCALQLSDPCCSCADVLGQHPTTLMEYASHLCLVFFLSFS